MEAKPEEKKEEEIKTEEVKKGKGKKGKEPKEGKEDKKGGKSKKVDVKVVKGARDFEPYQMAIRAKAFEIITGVFKKHGAVEIDTPIFELKETLMNKYGEDSKLIYDLEDQGGEILSLRYDLTVPFARFMAVHNYPSLKRYHIGKVYRRDQPQMAKGRFREFYQCDFDIAGPSYGKMIPDAEVLKVVVEILQKLNAGTFIIKINHRQLLDAMICVSGISNDKFKTVCSSIDKLDKMDWEEVKKELITKGISEECCDKLHIYVQMKDDPLKLITKLKENETIMGNQNGKVAVEEMEILINYLEIMKITSNFSFDLSLARGLDYYTGLIYEAILTSTDSVGSIAGGGRFDNLIGMFSGKQIPAVGVSIGIERIFNILEEQLKNNPSIRATSTEVLVANLGKNLTKQRFEAINQLWDNGIKAEILYNENPRTDKQLDYALSNRIPFILFIGENELKEGKYKIKCLANGTEILVEKDKAAEEILKLRENKDLLVVSELPKNKGKEKDEK